MSCSTSCRLVRFSLFAAAAAFFAAVFSLLPSAARTVAAQTDPAAQPTFYTDHVQPIFANNCYRCHGGMNHRGGLQLETPSGILKGGRDGVVIVPGDPAHSLLVQLIRHEGPADDPMPMPPHGKLSDADIATITTWIKAGAVMPPSAPPQ